MKKKKKKENGGKMRGGKRSVCLGENGNGK